MEEQRKERTIDELAAENDALRKKADELNKEIEYLQQQVNFLKKSVFGSKSEKKVLHDTENAEQLSLFNDAGLLGGYLLSLQSFCIFQYKTIGADCGTSHRLRA